MAGRAGLLSRTTSRSRAIRNGFKARSVPRRPLGRPMDPGYIGKHLKLALARAGLPKCGMHALRHTAATFMLRAGLNLHKVSRYLGHSQIGLTSDLYGPVLAESMREAAETLQKAYGSPGASEPAGAKTG